MGFAPSNADVVCDRSDDDSDGVALHHHSEGILPPQDTGFILAVTEAGTEVSFEEMQHLQEAVEIAVKKDPDVTGVAPLSA